MHVLEAGPPGGTSQNLLRCMLAQLIIRHLHGSAATFCHANEDWGAAGGNSLCQGFARHGISRQNLLRCMLESS